MTRVIGSLKLGYSAIRQLHSSIAHKQALKVAFFGSDDFSIPSLNALSALSKMHPELISSIDVIAKHPKPTGRDLKTTSDVAIAQTALTHGLNVIRAESNKEIIQLIPNGYSLAIAVSYGKLIPKKFIEEVPYSLNIHPSLLPKYSGASPLQYALMNEDAYTGVTIQTLHPTEFDKGHIVDQTDRISILKHEKLESLTHRLADIGSEMLVKVLTNGTYRNPSFKSQYEYSYAKKIPSSMKQIDWNSTADSIVARYNALGPLYSYKEIKVKQRRKPLIHDYRRVIFDDITTIEGDVLSSLQPGEFETGKEGLLVKTGNGTILCKSLQFEFQKKENAQTFWKHLPKRSGETTNVFTNNLTIN